MQIDADLLNGLAGLAALVNSLFMWPLLKSLKDIGKSHDQRLDKLENPKGA